MQLDVILLPVAFSSCTYIGLHGSNQCGDSIHVIIIGCHSCSYSRLNVLQKLWTGYISQIVLIDIVLLLVFYILGVSDHLC